MEQMLVWMLVAVAIDGVVLTTAVEVVKWVWRQIHRFQAKG